MTGSRLNRRDCGTARSARERHSFWMRLSLGLRHRNRCAPDLTVERTHCRGELRAHRIDLRLGGAEVWRQILGPNPPVVDMVVSGNSFSRPSGVRLRGVERSGSGPKENLFVDRGLKPGAVLNRGAPQPRTSDRAPLFLKMSSAEDVSGFPLYPPPYRS